MENTFWRNWVRRVAYADIVFSVLALSMFQACALVRAPHAATNLEFLDKIKQDEEIIIAIGTEQFRHVVVVWRKRPWLLLASLALMSYLQCYIGPDLLNGTYERDVYKALECARVWRIKIFVLAVSMAAVFVFGADILTDSRIANRIVWVAVKYLVVIWRGANVLLMFIVDRYMRELEAVLVKLLSQHVLLQFV